MADVFISYARSTVRQAREIALALQMAGYSVWIDDELPSHRAYADVIAEQIRAARAVVVVWSADAVASQWVRSEANRGRRDHKLVQVRVETAQLPMPFDQIQCIDLRQWQGEADAPAWRKVLSGIETLTRHHAEAKRPAPAAVTDTPHLAVLPFETPSGEPEMQALSDGIGEDIIHALGRDDGLSVVGRTASFQFRGERKQAAARELHATHVLDGIVRRMGARIRVGAELTVGASGAVLWSDRYDREADDLLALQEEIVGKVIAAVRGSLIGGPAKADDEAEPADSEHRVVSVLTVEIDGLAELAAVAGADEVAELRQRLFALLSEGIEAFDGFVERTTPSGVVGLFGAPVAYEDHAQRACYAALRLGDDIRRFAETVTQAHGVELSGRMGAGTGGVIVGRPGGGGPDYAAQGGAVTSALRLQALADPGSVYVDGATAAAVEGYVSLHDLGPIGSRGAGADQHSYRLEGVGPSRTRLDIARTRGLSAFVGRASDLHTLDEALKQSLAGSGQVIGVVAEAGAGKSRLCFEFLQHCRDSGAQVYESRALAHGRKIPFLTILDLVRAYLLVEPDDDAPTVRAKIEARMRELDPAFVEALPLIFDFVGAPDPERPAPALAPQVRRQQLIAVIRQLVRRLSEAQPIVTMIEDLHWLDPASAEFLEQVIDPRGGARSLLLVNFRPEFHADWMSKSWYRQIPLEPLGRAAVGELLADLLGRDPSIIPLTDLIHTRTAGNPFFVEELVQDLVETGQLEGPRGARRLVAPISEVSAPGTVKAVLTARIDRLANRDKRLLQMAAVIGKDFSETLLAEVADLEPDALREGLAALQAAEFVHETAVWPAMAYTFRHPLTQEVALGGQLADRRRKSHAAVARAIEALNPERLDEMAALIATHWSEAGEPRTSTAWWLRSARNTLARFEHDQALAQVGHGLSELEKLPQDEGRWQAELDLQVLAGGALMTTLGHGGAATAQAFNRALELCEKLPTSPQRVTVEFGAWVHLVHRLDFERGLALCDRILRRAVEEGSADWRFMGLRARAQLYFHVGRFAESLTDAELAIADWDSGVTQGLAGLMHDPGVISVHTYYSYALVFLGRIAEARREAIASVELGRQSGHHLMVAQCLFTEAVFFDLIGQDDQAQPLMQATLEYANEHGVAYFTAICSAYVGHMLARGGAPERGLPLVEAAVAGLKAAGSLVFVPGFLGRHGDVLTQSGSPEAALPLFEESLAMIERSGSRREEPFVRTWRARALAALGRDAEADEELAGALELARAQGSPLLQAYVLSELAPRLAQAGQADKARQWLADCLAGFADEADAPIVTRIRTLLAQASGAGDHRSKELGHA